MLVVAGHLGPDESAAGVAFATGPPAGVAAGARRTAAEPSAPDVSESSLRVTVPLRTRSRAGSRFGESLCGRLSMLVVSARPRSGRAGALTVGRSIVETSMSSARERLIDVTPAQVAALPCHARGWLYFSSDPASVAAAVRLCRSCPLLLLCRRRCDELERSTTISPHGVWGGETVEQRVRRRRDEGRARYLETL